MGDAISVRHITGVTVVDTQVANALLRAAQAVRLLGAQVVTRSSLQSGIAYAISQR